MVATSEGAARRTEVATAAPARTATSLAEIPEEVLVKRYGTTRAEVGAIKQALAPVGTTDYEMLLYMGVCHRLGLDAFVPGLVHFVRFKARGNQGERTGIVLGVYGYLQIAQQQKDCDGLAVKCYPEDVNAVPTYATATVWKKGWSHPLEVSVTFREKRRDTPFWNDSPRQALETAAIRRVCKLAWPSLFAPLDDDDADEAVPPGARGAVGTVLGEHHDPAPGPVDAEFRDALAPAPPPPVEELKAVVEEIREILDDPVVVAHPIWGSRSKGLLNSRLDTRHLAKLTDATVDDLSFIKALRDDLRQIRESAEKTP
jgi:RecT family